MKSIYYPACLRKRTSCSYEAKTFLTKLFSVEFEKYLQHKFSNLKLSKNTKHIYSVIMVLFTLYAILCIKILLNWAQWYVFVIPAFRKLWQEDGQFKASLDYKVSSRSAWGTEQKPVLQNKNKRTKNMILEIIKSINFSRKLNF